MRNCALPFKTGQRDYPGRDGLFVRVGRKTKTFIVAIHAGVQRQRIAIGRYPRIGLSAARDLRTEAVKQTGNISTHLRGRARSLLPYLRR
jgi:Arm DNA-binding domain